MSAYIAPGKDADVVLIDAPDGGTQSSGARRARVARSRVMQDFVTATH
jgi:cytosine/adenosine deaminase-related metal-dependent hydrolase